MLSPKINMRLVLFLFCICSLGAAESMDTSLDWRQLYFPSNCVRWHEKPESELRALSQQGHVVAKFSLAEKLYRNKNYIEAAKLKDEAAAAGLPQALAEKIVGIYAGENDTAPLLRQFDLAKRMAETGYPPGKLFLAMALLSGRPIKRDEEQALELVRSARDEAAPESARMLALLYAEGIGEPRHAGEKPMDLLRVAVKEGDREALGLLAHRYRIGYAVEKDLLRAAKIYFCLAANGPFTSSLDEIKLSPNDPDAPIYNRLVDLFVAGIRNGDPKALVTLAKMHTDGEYGPAYPPRAAALFVLAGETAASNSLAEKFTADEKKIFPEEMKWMQELRR